MWKVSSGNTTIVTSGSVAWSQNGWRRTRSAGRKHEREGVVVLVLGAVINCSVVVVLSVVSVRGVVIACGVVVAHAVAIALGVAIDRGIVIVLGAVIALNVVVAVGISSLVRKFESVLAAVLPLEVLHVHGGDRARGTGPSHSKLDKA